METGEAERRPFQAAIDAEQVLHAERLRDGRVALGTRTRGRDGAWEAWELIVLPPGAALALVAWLSPVVEREWRGTAAGQLDDQVATAEELYGDRAGGVDRLAERLLAEIPPRLMARGMMLLANSIGPAERERLVTALNVTADRSEEAMLRRRLAEEGDAFAYVVAAAALFAAMDEEGGL